MVLVLAGCGGLYKAEPGACVYNKPHEQTPPTPGLTLTVTLPDGSSQSCGAMWMVPDGGRFSPHPPAQNGAISGRVTASDASSFTVDTCAAGSGCTSESYRFDIDTPGLSLGLPLDRQVSVSWGFSAPWGCIQEIVVADVFSTALWFAGTDGAVDPALAKPFSVETKAISCSDPGESTGCGSVPPGDYAFVFTPVSGDRSLTLANRQTGTLSVRPDANTVQHVTIHNLRSYQTDRCDDYWNWAWWAVGQANANGDPE